jgi:hypothetical protein
MLKTILSYSGCMIMEPFNIKIPVQNENITLTILPADDGVFKIIYYGAIFGAVRSADNQGNWLPITIDSLTPGDLPFYSRKPGLDHKEIELNATTVSEIGKAIEQEQKTQGQ